MKELSGELLNKKLINYNVTDSTIAEIVETYSGLNAETKDGYTKIKKGIAELVSLRVKVEKRRKLFKSEVVGHIEKEAARVQGMIGPLELELKEKKRVIDDEEARIKAKKDRIEKERIDSLMAKVSEVRALNSSISYLNLTELNELGDKLSNINFTYENFQEFLIEATHAEKEVSESIAHAVLLKTEEAAKEEKDRLEKEANDKAEKEKLEVERAKIEAENKRLKEAVKIAKAAQDKLDAERIEQEKLVKEREDKINLDIQESKRRSDEIEIEAEKERANLEGEKEKFAEEKRKFAAAKIASHDKTFIKKEGVKQDKSKEAKGNAEENELGITGPIKAKEKRVIPSPDRELLIECVIKEFNATEENAERWLIDFEARK